MSYLFNNICRTRMSSLGAGAAAVTLIALPACSSDTEGPATVASTATATSSDASTSSPAPTSAIAAPTEPGATASNSFLSGPEATDAAADLEIEDQSGAGTEVLVDRVRLSSGPGHVAIFTVTGQLLGSAPVSDGATAVTVPLEPPVDGSGELLGVLYGDGDGGAFTLGVSPRIVDEEGDAEIEDFDYRLN